MIPARARLRLPLAVAATVGAVVALAGCGSGGSGSASAGGSSSSPATPSAAATATDAAGLQTVLRSGATSLKTAHLDMTVDAAGQSLTASGDEKLSGGKLKAMDLSEQIGTAGTIRIVIVDGKTYAQLPQSAGTTAKPWVLVTTDSTNPVVASMASTLQSVQQSASVDQYSAFAQAAVGVVPQGAEKVGEASTTHYSLTVDVSKMPDTVTGRQALISAGITTLPIELWVDGKGRPVKMTEQLSVQGQSVSTVVTLSRFDEPVTVTAPPADQVSTD